MVAEGECDRRDPFHRAFEGHAHCAGVVHVGRCIAAVVDSADDEVGRVVHGLVEGELDAVDRRSGTGAYLQARFIAEDAVTGGGDGRERTSGA